MLLRYRISILITLAILVTSASIVYVGFKREELFTEQYSQQLLSDQSNLWRKINSELIQRMQNWRSVVSENQELLRAIETGNSKTIQLLSNQLALQLQDQGGIDRFDLVAYDGSLTYSSFPSIFQSPIIAPEVAQSHIENDMEAMGIGNDEQRNVAVVYGFPLYSTSGSEKVIAMSLFAIGILAPINEMQRSTNSKVIFVNRRGRLLSSNEETLWKKLEESVDLGQGGLLQTINTDQNHYSVSVSTQAADLSSLVGRLVVVRNISDFVSGQQQIRKYSAISVTALIILLLIGLNYYMFHAFSPLVNGVKALSDLAQGNLYARLEPTVVDDEVGKISTAVRTFRAGLVALSRFRRSRERRRTRQEKFIFREMARLANILEGEERDKVISELEELRSKTQDTLTNADQEELFVKSVAKQHELPLEFDRSLALMASVFQQMSNRIQDQHHRLREALQTKEALISLRRELDIATRVQLSLLPRDLEISTSIHAAGSMSPAKEVGGDFFDFFRLDDHRIGITIADVSGKGIPAAMFMIMARTLLRSTVFHIHSPARILEYMNEYLSRNNDEQLFITLFYGVIDESTGILTYSTGGHNPPIVADSSGAWTLAQTDGLVLGLINDINYSETETRLESGSRLIMLTDGISEAFNQKEEAFGDDRTLETVRSLPKEQTSEEDVRYIIQRVQDFVGEAPQFDDMTCVVLRYDASS